MMTLEVHLIFYPSAAVSVADMVMIKKFLGVLFQRRQLFQAWWLIIVKVSPMWFSKRFCTVNNPSSVMVIGSFWLWPSVNPPQKRNQHHFYQQHHFADGFG